MEVTGCHLHESETAHHKLPLHRVLSGRVYVGGRVVDHDHFQFAGSSQGIRVGQLAFGSAD